MSKSTKNKMVPSQSTKMLLVVCLVCSQVAWMPLFALAQGKPATRMETIVKAWKAREARTQSGSFLLDQRSVRSKGSILSPSMIREINPKGLTFPAEDAVLDIKRGFAFNQLRFRETWNGPNFSESASDFVTHTRITVFDGTSTKVFSPSGLKQTQGSVHKGLERITDRNLMPILVTYRPFANELVSYSFKSDQYQIGKERATVDGRSCILIESRDRSQKKVKESFWVDPERDCCVVRFAVHRGTTPFLQITVQHSHDSVHGWVPAGWESLWLKKDGTMDESHSFKVKEYSLNSTEDPQQFQIDFPPGSYVIDHTDKTSYYIVRPGNEKRFITEGERTATYEQLLESESGMAFHTSPSLWRNWGIRLVVAMLILVVIWSGWKWARSLKSS